MHGIDISNWQGGLNISHLVTSKGKLAVDFVIMKATEGQHFVDSYCDNWVKQCKELGIKWGFYHFANNNNPYVEAEFFINHTNNYFKHGLPILDIEDNSISDWADYAWKFCSRVHEKTGVWPVVYCSASKCCLFADSKVPSKCGLWVAGYPVARTTWVKDYTLPYDIFPWKNAVMWQFTSSLRLNGYQSSLDGNISYITREQWDKYVMGDNKSKPSVKPKPVNKFDDVVFDVIKGKYGNGIKRRTLIKKAGYDYNKVQNRINEYYKIAHRVINGEYGNGIARISKLKNDGYNPECVQYIVNLLLK